jgi:peroxiredoxin
MKKIILPALLAFTLFACKEEQSGSFTISGTLKNTPVKLVYAEETIIATGEKKMMDSSAIAADGKYSINIKTKEEGIYSLRLQSEPLPFVTVINDASKIDLDADFNKQYDFYSVSGSAASKSIQDYMAKLSEWQREKFDNLRQADSIRNSGGDAGAADNLLGKANEISMEMKTYTQQTVQKADKAALALFILAKYQGDANNPNYRMLGYTIDELVGLLNEMLTKFPDRTDIAGIRNSVEAQRPKTLMVGAQAPEISLPDTQGKAVSLSSYRGKYVLVDFWASWCGPCRRENPNVVDAYNRFKNKNFTILGVSLDNNKEAWEKAIAVDGLNWTHISDLKKWESIVVPTYRIQGIPFNVLVDPEGKIVAENLRGPALDEKLAQVLN